MPSSDVIKKFILSKSKYVEEGKGENRVTRWNLKGANVSMYKHGNNIDLNIKYHIERQQSLTAASACLLVLMPSLT